MKIPTGQEYAAKIINTKKLSARGRWCPLCVSVTFVLLLQAHHMVVAE